MPIDFTASKSKHELHKSHRVVRFSEKLHSYFVACQSDFSNYPAILNDLTDICDTYISEDDMKHLLRFCSELQAIAEEVSDYSFFDRWKAFGVRQTELSIFANELSDLIHYALDSNEQIWSVGE